MKLHVLIDNLPNPANHALLHEHGLCILLSLNGNNFLIDTGASGKFLENLQLLRESDNSFPLATEIDAVIISHGHNDHTGGLRRFFEHNSSAPVYLHNSIRGNYFYSCRPKNGIREARNIGMEQALFIDHGHRFIELEEPMQLCGQITLLLAHHSANPSSITPTYPTPMGNEFLYKNDFPDDFSHELIILIEYSTGCYAVVSPCTHNGILNVLEVCVEHIAKLSGRERKECAAMIKLFVGGLHYVDYLGMGHGKKETASIIETANLVKNMYPCMKIFSGHCTCSNAGNTLECILEERYSTFYCGCSILASRTS